MTLTEKIHSERKPDETMTQCTARLRLEKESMQNIEPVVQEEKVHKPLSFSDMKVKELRQYARKNNIDLGKTTKKSDIVEIICG